MHYSTFHKHLNKYLYIHFELFHHTDNKKGYIN